MTVCHKVHPWQGFTRIPHRVCRNTCRSHQGGCSQRKTHWLIVEQPLRKCLVQCIPTFHQAYQSRATLPLLLPGPEPYLLSWSHGAIAPLAGCSCTALQEKDTFGMASGKAITLTLCSLHRYCWMWTFCKRKDLIFPHNSLYILI